jgi:hypothetical protein
MRRRASTKKLLATGGNNGSRLSARYRQAGLPEDPHGCSVQNSEPRASTETDCAV